MATATVRWGILGLGSIARTFATGLKAVPGAQLVAVGSRDAGKAKAFAADFGAARAHASYEALCADPGVDAIYVATPHPNHRENALAVIAGGKALLCEKPFTVNADELVEIVAAARKAKRFAMEAMWTRFLPVHAKVRDWIARGAIGEPRMVTADFGFRAGLDPTSRLFDQRLAGGGLLDVGVYTIALANMALGAAAEKVAGFAHLGETGVDEQAAMVLAYPGGRLASLTCAVRTNTPQDARIDGTEGSIRIPGFWHTTRAELHGKGGARETVEIPNQGNGYEHEAIEVGRCLAAGLTESPVIPLDESVAIMRTMDELRRQWGLRYPFEQTTKAGRA
ncbi:MAG TPA: Gfo/Idh/MocA family oxidoreductase [Planctomycetota bacterium]|nr:Gfo/Idh/MocA family oxidoreductase [Planctomycetota bacterium]